MKALVIKEENGEKAIYLYGFDNIEEFCKELMHSMDNNCNCYLVKQIILPTVFAWWVFLANFIVKFVDNTVKKW